MEYYVGQEKILSLVTHYKIVVNPLNKTPQCLTTNLNIVVEASQRYDLRQGNNNVLLTIPRCRYSGAIEI